MCIEDPNLVRQSRKASRRRAATHDLMRALTKHDRVTAKVEQLAHAQRRYERQAERWLRDLDHTRASRPH